MAKRSRDETDVRRGHVGVGWNADRDGYGPSYFGRKYPKTPTTRHEMQLFQKMTKWTSAVVDTTRFSKKKTGRGHHTMFGISKRTERKFVPFIDVCENDQHKNVSFCDDAKLRPANHRGR